MFSERVLVQLSTGHPPPSTTRILFIWVVFIGVVFCCVVLCCCGVGWTGRLHGLWLFEKGSKDTVVNPKSRWG